MTNHTYYCELTHEGVISIQGPDAAKFLQGQITCNLNYLDAQHSSLGARCNVKGRMLSSFQVLPHAQGFLLALDKELVEPQLADLKKYAVFSKAELSDASADWRRIGLGHADAALSALNLLPAAEFGSVASQGQIYAIRLDAVRIELWAPADEMNGLIARLNVAPGDLNQWQLDQIQAGIGQVFAATRELFVPQMLNLQAVGGVSFKKGCYTGQEIVARMQYLGKLKRRMYRLSLPDTQLPAPGTELFSPVHASSVGEVVIAAKSGQGIELLAVVQEDAIADARVHLSSIDGPRLVLESLPYALDRDKEIQR